MTNEEMMRQLYERMAAEQQKYKAWLLEQPPNVILDNACKYTVREDIVMEMEVLKLTDAQAAACCGPGPRWRMFTGRGSRRKLTTWTMCGM